MDPYEDKFADLLGYDQNTMEQIPWEFSLRQEIVMTPQFSEALRRIARMHKKCKATGQSDSLFISAQSGVGKTTLLEYYSAQFPRFDEDNRTVIPVVHVVTPANPTELSFTTEILAAIGESSERRAADNVNKICHFLSECGCELLMIDEIQHFVDRKKIAEGRKVSDSVKILMQEIKKPVVIAGLPRAVEFVKSNMQLARRSSSRHKMLPFSFEEQDEQKQFRGFLKGLQEKLPIQSIELRDARVAQRFFYASAGIIDYVIKILEGAVQLAAEQKIQLLDLALFAEAYKEKVWADAPESLNPFLENAYLRFLNQPDEPFAGWDYSMDRGKQK